MTTESFGFWCAGKNGKRRPVDRAAVFRAHAAADPQLDLAVEAFTTHYVFTAEFDDYLAAYGTEADYGGPCCTDFLILDVDREADVEAALIDTRRLVHSIRDRYHALSEEDMLIFLSGGKGFHVGLPAPLWAPTYSVDFPSVARRFCEAHAERAGVKIDTGVYSRTRLMRLPNTRHSKTGLYKRRISAEELDFFDLEHLLEMGQAPAPFELPVITATDPAAVADWAAAAVATERRAAEVRAAHAEGAPKLHATTVDYIANGVEVGERHDRSFRAAANLMEVYLTSGIEALIEQLLIERTLDLGLKPSDAERQIRCGIERARRQHGGIVL